MVQEFQVLRCFSCNTFQVHQVKKSKKWTCKLCGEKQSLLKVYGQGSGADCRHHVQKLNLLQGERQQQEADNAAGLDRQEENSEEDHEDDIQDNTLETGVSVSRWNKYLEKVADKMEEQENEEGSLVYTDRQQLYSEQKKEMCEKRKKKKLLQMECEFYNPDFHNSKEIPSQGSMNSVKRAKTSKDWTSANREDLEASFHVKPEDKGAQHASPISTKSKCTESKWGKFLSPSPSEEIGEDNISCSEDNWMANSPGLSMESNKKSQNREVNNRVQESKSPNTAADQAKISSDETTCSKNFPATCHPNKMSIELSRCADDRYVISCGTAVCVTDHGDTVLGSSVAKLSPKHITHSVLFQTDDDFEDNY
ncbi:MRN complex-interacting protein [Discoglossus pictus]